ncbi:hypothetical protein NEFER03_0952 [Nematocida sp. LUAm3]|nr:hypothetical protein NEFER03_0952 [Nematocida sp. LUAm3]KAI5174970.1 hypothetical protein NEFER02_1070 [Nematocida sp. LUAm2]KAI5177431.1 hypothetical protein NEFER01_0681 [Nematocida sp. LUAm1]
MLKIRKYQGNAFLGLILLFMCFSSLKAADPPRLMVEEEEEMPVLSPIINNKDLLPSGSQKNIKLSDAESPHKPSSLLGKRLSSNNTYPETTQHNNPLFVIIDEGTCTSGTNPSITSPDVPTCSTNNIQGTNYQSAFTPYSSTSGMPSSSSQPSIKTQDVSSTPSCSYLPSLLSIPMANIGGSSLQAGVSERHKVSSLSTSTVFKKILLLGSNDELELIRMNQGQNNEESSYTVFYNMPTQEEFLPILNQHKFVIVYVAVGRASDGLSMLLQIIRKNKNLALNLIFEWINFTDLDSIQESSITKHPSEYWQKFSFTTYIEPFFMLVNTHSNFITDCMHIIESISDSLYKGYSSRWYNAIYLLRSPILESKKVPENCFPCVFFNLLVHSSIEEVGIFSMDSQSYTNIGLLTIPFLTPATNILHIKRIIILEPNVGCYSVIKSQINYCSKYIDVTYNHWKHIYLHLKCSSQGKSMQEIIIRNIFLYQVLTQNTKAPSTSSEEHASTSFISSIAPIAPIVPKKANYNYIHVEKLNLHLNLNTKPTAAQIVSEVSVFDSILNWLASKEICCVELQIEVDDMLWTKEKELQCERIQNGNKKLFPISTFNRSFVPPMITIVNAENKKRITMQIKKPLLAFMPAMSPRSLLIAPIQISMQIYE